MTTDPSSLDYGLRLAQWREACLERKRTGRFGQDTTRVRADSLRASEHLPLQVRRGLCTRAVLEATEFALGDAELLMGRLAWRVFDSADPESQAAQAYLQLIPWVPGQTGHCELDLTRLFEQGVDGLMVDLVRRHQAASGDVKDTYQSFIDVLAGFSAMCETAARTADASIPAAQPARQVELRRMADSCRRIAHQPPATFRDALQINWFATLGTMAEGVNLVGPGRLDRRLIHYYEQDLAAGRLTAADALCLLESLYLIINETIQDGVAVAVMVGGRDAGGHDTTNELSYLCLEALRRSRLVYPTVGVCWHAGTPEALIERAVDLIGHGYSTPAFFGDETIQRGLRRHGVAPSESHDYINSTCVEITPCGASNVWVASPYFSTCKILLEEIAAQASAPVETFEEFWSSYQARLAGAIQASVAAENSSREVRRTKGRKPFQSLFTRDCLERGRDIDDGGACYNWVECSFVGLANLADSLVVIREEVFGQRRMTLAQLHQILTENFEGQEPVRLRFLNAHPKYGVGSPVADEWIGKIAAVVTRECARHSMKPDGSPFIPGAFCWIMHELLGRDCGATPDGRKAGFPFADGGGPAQGRETLGPTAAIRSVTSWDPSAFIGGVAFNLKFNSRLFETPAAFKCLRDLIVTYLAQGGFEAQVNVVDHTVLQKARENPEAYRDLVVRIGGYTDYFTRLSPQMQAEVMQRTEFQSL